MSVIPFPVRGNFISALETLEGVERDLDWCELPFAIGRVEAIGASLYGDMLKLAPRQAPVAAPDLSPARLLNVKETADRLGRSPTWVYRHQTELPRVTLPGGGVAFSDLKLERWIDRHSA